MMPSNPERHGKRKLAQHAWIDKTPKSLACYLVAFVMEYGQLMLISARLLPFYSLVPIQECVAKDLHRECDF
jgi:hypothetical protein